ncbi:MAG: hypothetical protein EFKGCFLK_02604 [Rhodocyclaceae bacterium]|nr:MAG: SseB family protein [Rhodocyclaceae bacterium]MBE7421069.1 SseB family protein [Zoogloeaceae bacterium]MBV6408985.1 hypothetical protein [Rhodocyclaceae bacterium]MCK6382899.1 SseB family protein [Rhodocyclaceae bacterium]CAG0930839.1 hypothetical protein RHDC3_01643 [Rhodocyclaceae bacterium]
MSEADAPRNPLEALLLEFHEGRLEPEDFARRLIDEQVFMPVRDDKRQIAGFQSSTLADPLVLELDAGQRVLVLFSEPGRAGDFLAHFPGYGGGMLVEFAWVLRRMAADLSISINPDQTPGYDLDPEMIAMLAGLLPEENQ